MAREFSSVANGVLWSPGKGKDRPSVVITADSIMAWAKRCKKNIPRVFDRAERRAAKTLRNRFEEVVKSRGGKYGVPQWADFTDFTKHLRRVDNIRTPMGGKLSHTKKIVFYKKNGQWCIGWPDRLAEWAAKFQDATPSGYPGDDFASRFVLTKFRDIPADVIPDEYEQNPRPLVEPMAAHADTYLRTWAKEMVEKQFAREMVKTGEITMMGV